MTENTFILRLPWGIAYQIIHVPEAHERHYSLDVLDPEDTESYMLIQCGSVLFDSLKLLMNATEPHRCLPLSYIEANLNCPPHACEGIVPAHEIPVLIDLNPELREIKQTLLKLARSGPLIDPNTGKEWDPADYPHH